MKHWTILLLFLIYIQYVLTLPALRDVDIWTETSDKPKNNFINFTSEAKNGINERIPRVLNFFPVPVEEECLSNDGRRTGTCMNTYECRIQSGTSHGPCALGFGVCCVFTATCSNEVFNNITYFVNPDFPDLSKGMSTCEVVVKKIDPEIVQLRLDFIHFTLGQPNRKTGVCEDDLFVMSGGTSRDLRLCGVNSGQHIYYDVDNIDTPINITMNLSKITATRLWEVRITQIPFTERAPNGCLQYHMGPKGTIQTMNFADNGRHLADQEYTICMRQEEDMCSILYEPCDEESFKISPNNNGAHQDEGNTSPSSPVMDSPSDVTQEGPPPVDSEGAPSMDTEVMDSGQELGSGDGDTGAARMMNMCFDRIILPCDSEDFIMAGEYGPGYCTMSHCGNSFCPEGSDPCRIESTVTPFTIGVHFGQNAREAPPEENLGMCLTYEQLPCIV